MVIQSHYEVMPAATDADVTQGRLLLDGGVMSRFIKPRPDVASKPLGVVSEFLGVIEVSHKFGVKAQIIMIQAVVFDHSLIMKYRTGEHIAVKTYRWSHGRRLTSLKPECSSILAVQR
jgi:hypothetical protein